MIMRSRGALDKGLDYYVNGPNSDPFSDKK
jgi:hypothetical protein